MTLFVHGLLLACICSAETAANVLANSRSDSAKESQAVAAPIVEQSQVLAEAPSEQTHCENALRCADQQEGPWENLSLLLALDGSKQPQDLGVNAQFGGRGAVNMGLPLVRRWGLGLQIGSAIDQQGAAVHVLKVLGLPKDRFQSFTTVGVFQRLDNGLKWGVGYDWLFENYYDNFDLGQVRGLAGYSINAHHEVGSWFAISTGGDNQLIGGAPIFVKPITQGSLYYRYTFASMAQLTGWVGAADKHGENILIVPGSENASTRVLFGAELNIPLNQWVALFGQANFIQPVDTGTVDAYLGLAFYPGKGAIRQITNTFAPIQAVASNPTFAVDMRR